MANRKLYTGNPIGTYEYGDKHPTLDMYFMSYVGKYERWADFNEFQRSFKFRHRIEQAKKAKQLKPKRVSRQTGRPVGTYRYGDEHPNFPELRFIQYSRGIEQWANPEQMEMRREASRRYAAKHKPQRMARHVLAARNNARDVVWSWYRQERDYNKLYWSYGAKVNRSWKSNDDLRKERRDRRRRYRQNNPAKRREERLARKGKVKACWRELSLDEKRQANDRYKWRDMLNKIHGKIVFVVDHVKPLAGGGLHHPDNLMVTTYKFNEWKSDRDVEVVDFYNLRRA